MFDEVHSRAALGRFLTLAAVRRGPLGRTWLLIGVVFGLVSAWPFYQG